MNSAYEPSSVAILGCGAVGGFLAAVFWKGGTNVVCLDKSGDVARINQKGIQLKSSVFGNFIARPKAEEKLSIKPDLVFITVKATSLEEALKQVDPRLVSSAIVIPLLNGLEYVAVIRAALGRQVAAGSISIEVFRPAEDEVVHSSESAVVNMASDADIPETDLKNLRDWLCSLGVKASLGKSEAHVLWEKLIRLNALALATSITDRPIGILREDKEWRDKILSCLNEASTVAGSLGVKIDPKEEMKFLDSLAPTHLSSMQRDIAAGRPSEIDAITGAILRLAKIQGQDCPVIANLYRQLVEKISS